MQEQRFKILLAISVKKLVKLNEFDKRRTDDNLAPTTALNTGSQQWVRPDTYVIQLLTQRRGQAEEEALTLPFYCIQ